MTFSSVELWQRISASQLASPIICRTWAAETAAHLAASDAIDGRKVAEQLVAQGKLTRFQADALVEGSDQPLVIHGYRVLEPVNYSPYPAPHVRSIYAGWWLAAKSATATPTWMRWVDVEQLKQPLLSDAQPSLPRALQHAQVHHAHLQTVYPPEMADGRLQLSLQPVSGQLLSGLCDGRTKPLEMVTRIWREVASALAALHAAGLTHGRVTPDRICLLSDGQAHVLRDPLCGQTLSLNKDGQRPAVGGLLSHRLPGKLSAAHLMAPEFLLPAQAATPQTDIYSLGCVLWMLLVGKPPFHADQPDKILAAHAEKPLNQAALIQLPPPLQRCLWHCLAKNPNARFASGQQLIESLKEAERLSAIGPTLASQPKKKTKPADPTSPPVKPAEAALTAELVSPSAAIADQPTSSPQPLKSHTPAITAEPTSVPSPVAADTAAGGAELVDPSTIHPSTIHPSTNSATPGPGPRRAAPGKPPARRTPQRGVRKGAGQRKSHAWLTPVIGGGGLVALILMLVVFRGSGNSRSSSSDGNQSVTSANNNSTGSTSTPEAAPVDPLLERFELVDAKLNALWAPPRAGQPLALDMLPPGAQAYVALRPIALLESATNKQLLSLLDSGLGEFWKWLYQVSGVPMESMEQVIVAAYPGHEGRPQYALRVKLLDPWPLSKLKGAWNLTTELKVGQQTLLVSDTLSFYVPQQPLVDSQSVPAFSVGFTELMREVASMKGSQGPLSSALEQLWQNTDRQADFNFLLNPVFLFTEGRGWLEDSPPRWRAAVEQWLPRETRGFMMTSSIGERWYYELRMIGTSDREAVATQQRLSDLKNKLPQEIEMWLVNETPHPHWRALAIRFPGMLRALGGQTRVGVENGQAIANGYLPNTAAPNLIYASWMAMLPTSTATTAASTANANTSPMNTGSALTPGQILERKITLSVDPTGIEFILAQIAEQANENLPAGTRPLKFELNGKAFQLAGFTRNQQIQDFKVANQSVREALSLLVQKANPEKQTDLRSPDQKMIWVITDADNPELALVSLTSREAAAAAGQTLPVEFTP